MSKPHCCIDVMLPSRLNNVAYKTAAKENPANRNPFEAASLTAKLWKPGREITVCFLDGDQAVCKKVEQTAKQWEQFANIKFKFIAGPNAEIRISFKHDGSWSAVGTDCLIEEFFPETDATMNYGWLTSDSTDSDYSSVVLHEFGHALGMIHEHESPANSIQWNKEAVYKSLGGPPNNWDKETIDHNMFDKYTHTQTQFTQFDPKSIMLYSFPPEWTTNNQSFKENTVLSVSDKAFIAARYPGVAVAALNSGD